MWGHARYWTFSWCAMVRHGRPYRVSCHDGGTAMGSHGSTTVVSWHHHGDAMGIMRFHSRSWHFMGVRGFSQTAMGFHGNPMAVSWRFMAVSWGFMAPTAMNCYEKVHGVIISMFHCGAMGNPMCHGLPLTYYDTLMHGSLHRPTVSWEWHGGECHYNGWKFTKTMQRQYSHGRTYTGTLVAC